ncbi:TetR/AcrR family transcriptional regulator, partial [Fusobacterium nucleatum]|uniref:TetR/AcrR family transcriptional regulator n=2 Tax=Fusobacteriaceae TaxID=203492 RepID=UPI001F51E6E1
KAKDMILTESYSNLSISKLTSELNISKGSFYTYFPSKDKMLSEILDEYKEKVKI